MVCEERKMFWIGSQKILNIPKSHKFSFSDSDKHSALPLALSNFTFSLPLSHTLTFFFSHSHILTPSHLDALTLSHYHILPLSHSEYSQHPPTHSL